jgi:hypothetical protein
MRANSANACDIACLGHQHAAWGKLRHDIGMAAA